MLPLYRQYRRSEPRRIPRGPQVSDTYCQPAPASSASAPAPDPLSENALYLEKEPVPKAARHAYAAAVAGGEAERVDVLAERTE
jgi:hypothetical protein